MLPSLKGHLNAMLSAPGKGARTEAQFDQCMEDRWGTNPYPSDDELPDYYNAYGYCCSQNTDVCAFFDLNCAQYYESDNIYVDETLEHSCGSYCDGLEIKTDWCNTSQSKRSFNDCLRTRWGHSLDTSPQDDQLVDYNEAYGYCCAQYTDACSLVNLSCTLYWDADISTMDDLENAAMDALCSTYCDELETAPDFCSGTVQKQFNKCLREEWGQDTARAPQQDELVDYYTAYGTCCAQITDACTVIDLMCPSYYEADTDAPAAIPTEATEALCVSYCDAVETKPDWCPSEVLSTGAIVGIVIAGVAVVGGTVGAVAYFLVCRTAPLAVGGAA